MSDLTSAGGELRSHPFAYGHTWTEKRRWHGLMDGDSATTVELLCECGQIQFVTAVGYLGPRS